MEISSQSTSQTVSLDAQKKAQDVQSQQVLKILESVNQQTQQSNAQKTGLGTQLNLSA